MAMSFSEFHIMYERNVEKYSGGQVAEHFDCVVMYACLCRRNISGKLHSYWQLFG